MAKWGSFLCNFYSSDNMLTWRDLTFTSLWANSADEKLMISFLKNVSQKTDFDISSKLSIMETIYMKCKSLYSGKNKKNISKCVLKYLPYMLCVNKVFMLRT